MSEIELFYKRLILVYILFVLFLLIIVGVIIYG